MVDLDIAAFLLARLNEREQRQWLVHDTECAFGSHSTDLVELTVPSAVCDCPEPAFVLADVAAKRQIIAMHERAVSEYDTNHGLGGTVRVRFVFCGGCQCEDGVITGEWPCDHLRLLAVPYAGHPDYDESWKL